MDEAKTFKTELVWHLYPDEAPTVDHKDYLVACQDEYGRMVTVQMYVSPSQGWTWEDTEIFAWAEIPELNFEEE